MTYPSIKFLETIETFKKRALCQKQINAADSAVKARYIMKTDL